MVLGEVFLTYAQFWPRFSELSELIYQTFCLIDWAYLVVTITATPMQ